MLLLALGCSLLPVPVACGTAAMGYYCVPAPDPTGHLNVYYEIEPLLVAAIEFATGTSIRVFYYAGYDRQRV
jgi:hypothetical protein